MSRSHRGRWRQIAVLGDLNALGTAFLVSKCYVLTAYHCLHDKRRGIDRRDQDVSVSFGEHRFTARFECGCEDADVALLRLCEGEFEHLPEPVVLTELPAQPPVDFKSWGFTDIDLGKPFALPATGKVVEWDYPINDALWMYCHSDFSREHGMSGAPLALPDDGPVPRVYALHSGHITRIPALSVAHPIHPLPDCMRHLVAQPTPTPAIANPASDAAAQELIQYRDQRAREVSYFAAAAIVCALPLIGAFGVWPPNWVVPIVTCSLLLFLFFFRAYWASRARVIKMSELIPKVRWSEPERALKAVVEGLDLSANVSATRVPAA